MNPQTVTAILPVAKHLTVGRTYRVIERQAPQPDGRNAWVKIRDDNGQDTNWHPRHFLAEIKTPAPKTEAMPVAGAVKAARDVPMVCQVCWRRFKPEGHRARSCGDCQRRYAV